MVESKGPLDLDIIALGEPLIEFNQTSPSAADYRCGFGGDTSNAIIAAARQGAKTGYITAIGQDAFGAMLTDLWTAEGVDISAVRRDVDGYTGIYFVTHGKTGHIFSYRRAGSAASRMVPEQLDGAYVGAAKFLHVSGISQAISGSACDTVFAAMEQARAAGARVSYDTNLRLKLWPLARARAVTNATVAMADVIFPSLEDATVLTGLEDPDEIVDFYLRLGVPLVVLKLGATGVIVADGQTRCAIAGHRVASVDATGAGDTFDGSFLARMALGDTPQAAARYANAAAALSTCGFGAVAPIPLRQDVEAFLSAQAAS